jgi:hypothetical protein
VVLLKDVGDATDTPVGNALVLEVLLVEVELVDPPPQAVSVAMVTAVNANWRCGLRFMVRRPNECGCTSEV